MRELDFELIVNSFPARVRLSEEGHMRLEKLLDSLMELREEKGRRVIVFVAGMPGAGKSTLALLLASLAQEEDRPYRVQALGLDGFHYPQRVLETTLINGVPLAAVKGSPESFDCAGFLRALAEFRQGETGRWPVYDRRLHDVSGETTEVTGDILLVEGNWLLLAKENWRAARETCDRTLLLAATLETVKPRLIARKMRGGRTREEAEKWFEEVDGPNCLRFLRESIAADETIEGTLLQTRPE